MTANRESQISRVTLVGMAVNVALLTLKAIAGVVGHSSAMIADAVHSLSDFVTDLIVLMMVRISGKPQDATHDYGHGKYETMASFVIGLALVAAAVGIIVGGVMDMVKWFQGATLRSPGQLALWAALISIVVKEALYRYTARCGKRLDSSAMIANAWHHRSDALSSIGAAVGIGGAIVLGDRWAVLDAVASVVVGAMLVRVAIGLLHVSMDELTESSLPADVEGEIVDIITSFDDVSEPHNLRTRRIGNRIAIEAHVRMDGNLPLSQVHSRASAIENAIRRRFGPQTHVTLHMEPV